MGKEHWEEQELVDSYRLFFFSIPPYWAAVRPLLLLSRAVADTGARAAWQRRQDGHSCRQSIDPCLISPGFYVSDPPAAQGRFLFPITIMVRLFVYGDAGHGFLFSLFLCPCPSRASGKGEAYFLVVSSFSYSWILNFSGLDAYLLSFTDTWWLQVSCCGRSLFVHSSGVTIRPSQASLYACSCLLPWFFSFASWGLHGFLRFVLLCTALTLFVGLIRSRGGWLRYSYR